MYKKSQVLLLILICQSCSIMPSSYEAQLLRENQKTAAPSKRVEIKKTYIDGSRYVGQAVDNLPSGKGVLILKNGNKYDGLFSDGRKHGKGVLTTRKGEVYSGLFENDYFTSGTWSKRKGDSVEGTFARNKTAVGTLNFNKKALYAGELAYKPKNGYYPQGAGESYDKNGYKYKGHFKTGKKSGEFIKTGKGAEYFEVWKNDVLLWTALSPSHLRSLDNKCKIKSDGSSWLVTKGNCRKGLLQGNGFATRKDARAVAFGKFSKGQLIDGELIVYEGISYRGRFSNLRPHGKDVEEYKNKDLLYAGGFKNGVRHGEGVCNVSGNMNYCEYTKGERIDAVYLAKKQLDNLRAFAKQHKLKIDKKLTAEIDAKKSQFYREHQSRIKSLEREMTSYTTASFISAVAKGTAYNMQGNTAASNAAIKAQAEKVNRKKEEIEREKQNYRRKMQAREAKWIREKKAQIARRQYDFDPQYKQWLADAKAECRSIPNRVWKDSLCLPKKGLNKTEIASLKKVLRQQENIRSGASRAPYASTRALNDFANQSKNKWNSRIREAKDAEKDRQRWRASSLEHQAWMDQKVAEEKEFQRKTKAIGNTYKKRDYSAIYDSESSDDSSSEDDSMAKDESSSTATNSTSSRGDSSSNAPSNSSIFNVAPTNFKGDVCGGDVCVEKNCQSLSQDAFISCKNNCYREFPCEMVGPYSGGASGAVEN